MQPPILSNPLNSQISITHNLHKFRCIQTPKMRKRTCPVMLKIHQRNLPRLPIVEHIMPSASFRYTFSLQRTDRIWIRSTRVFVSQRLRIVSPGTQEWLRRYRMGREMNRRYRRRRISKGIPVFARHSQLVRHRSCFRQSKWNKS